MISEERVRQRLAETERAISAFMDQRAREVAQLVRMVAETCRRGNQVLIFGNGGSAAEAQHIAAELVNRMLKDRAPLPAIALTTDSSIITSIANDYDFDQVFVKQIEALGRPGDLAWGLSTSGRSRNVNLALAAAGRKGMKRAGLAGRPGSPIGEVTDLCVFVDHDSTPVIQEIHLAAAHIVCELVEAELFGEGG